MEEEGITSLERIMNGCAVSWRKLANTLARPPEPAIAMRILFSC